MTIEEIKKHFEGAKTVKCLADESYCLYDELDIQLTPDKKHCFIGEYDAVVLGAEKGFAEIIDYYKEPHKETIIQAVIAVGTDGDFSLTYGKPERCDYIMKFDGNYEFELTLEESTAVSVLKEFLKSFKISSSKDWHEKQLKDGINNYLNQLDKNLCSSEDLLGGGNWSFRVDVIKISKTYL
jgi:hypothetical protein